MSNLWYILNKSEHQQRLNQQLLQQQLRQQLELPPQGMSSDRFYPPATTPTTSPTAGGPSRDLLPFGQQYPHSDMPFDPNSGAPVPPEGHNNIEWKYHTHRPEADGDSLGRKAGKRKLVIPRDLLKMKQMNAALKIGIPPSTFSKRWRESLPDRTWPYRNHRRIEKNIKMLKAMQQKGHDVTEELGRMQQQQEENLSPAVIDVYEDVNEEYLMKVDEKKWPSGRQPPAGGPHHHPYPLPQLPSNQTQTQPQAQLPPSQSQPQPQAQQQPPQPQQQTQIIPAQPITHLPPQVQAQLTHSPPTQPKLAQPAPQTQPQHQASPPQIPSAPIQATSPQLQSAPIQTSPQIIGLPQSSQLPQDVKPPTAEPQLAVEAPPQQSPPVPVSQPSVESQPLQSSSQPQQTPAIQSPPPQQPSPAAPTSQSPPTQPSPPTATQQPTTIPLEQAPQPPPSSSQPSPPNSSQPQPQVQVSPTTTTTTPP